MLLLSKYLKTGKVVILCLFFLNNILISQTNLINNSSFELYNNVTNFNTGNGFFFDYSVMPVQRIVLNWDVINSPDYYSAAYTYTYTFKGVPINTFGSEYPKNGIAYAGIYAFMNNSESKEYVYQQLNYPLKTDSIYCLSFFASRADRTNYSIKKIGAYFSVNTPTVNAFGYISAIPQVLNTNNYISDTTSWTEIKQCFVAQGSEDHITIGNFNSNANTDTLFVGTNNPFSGGGSNHSYYYIDSVTLWQNNFPTSIKENSKEDVVSVWPNPSGEIINVKCKMLNVKSDFQIKLTDILGREALVTEFKEQLDVSHLQNGIYFLSLHEDKKLLGTKKIIKQ